MAGILIVAREWTPRVLVRAQLEEEGHEVTGRLTLDDGLLDLRAHPRAYSAVVVDTASQDLSGQTLRRLAAASPPVILLTGPFDLPSVAEITELFARVLVRQVSVGDVVDAVRDVL